MDDTIHPQRAFNDFWRQRASPEESKMAAWGGYPLLEPLTEPVFAMDPEVNDGSSVLDKPQVGRTFPPACCYISHNCFTFFSSKLCVCVTSYCYGDHEYFGVSV